MCIKKGHSCDAIRKRPELNRRVSKCCRHSTATLDQTRPPSLDFGESSGSPSLSHYYYYDHDIMLRNVMLWNVTFSIAIYFPYYVSIYICLCPKDCYYYLLLHSFPTHFLFGPYLSGWIHIGIRRRRKRRMVSSS